MFLLAGTDINIGLLDLGEHLKLAGPPSPGGLLVRVTDVKLKHLQVFTLNGETANYPATVN